MTEILKKEYDWRKGPDEEQVMGLKIYQQEFMDRIERISRIHSYISPASQKAIDFVFEKKKRDDFYKSWYQEGDDT